VADERTAGRDWIAWFPVWFNSPAIWSSGVTFYGFSTARLGIFPGGFSVFSTPLERRVHRWERADYQWPAVVLERFRPVGTSLLFDFKGEIALCAPWGRSVRVRAALTAAGLEVIEVSVRGSVNRPQAVPHQLLGPAAEHLPTSVVAYNEWAIKTGGWRRVNRRPSVGGRDQLPPAASLVDRPFAETVSTPLVPGCSRVSRAATRGKAIAAAHNIGITTPRHSRVLKGTQRHSF
jgi:hypothetical protein